MSEASKRHDANLSLIANSVPASANGLINAMDNGPLYKRKSMPFISATNRANIQ